MEVSNYQDWYLVESSVLLQETVSSELVPIRGTAQVGSKILLLDMAKACLIGCKVVFSISLSQVWFRLFLELGSEGENIDRSF